MIQSALDTYYNCIYLHKIIFIHVKKLTKYKKGVSARTAIFQLGKEWKVEEGAWQCRELGGAHGVLWGLLRGERGRSNFHSKVTSGVGDCLDQGGILRM